MYFSVIYLLNIFSLNPLVISLVKTHIHTHTHKCKKSNAKNQLHSQTHTDIYAQTVTHNTQEVVVTACINYVTLCNQLLRLLQHTALCILRVNYVNIMSHSLKLALLHITFFSFLFVSISYII